MIAAGFKALIEVRTAEATETHTSGVGASWAHTSNRGVI